MTKKRIIAIVCAVLIAAAAVSAAAYTAYRFRTAEKPVERQYVDRVNLSLDRTAFTFDQPPADGMLICETTLTVEKSEAEFYGKLVAVTVEGGKNVIFTAGHDNGDAVLPQDLILPATAEAPIPLSWTVSFGVPYEEGKTDYEAALVITLETGMNAQSTDVRQARFPVTLTVEAPENE